MTDAVADDPGYAHLIELAFAFWRTQVLYAGVELDIFTTLSEGPLSRDELASRCDIHERAAAEFLDALVSLELLECQAGRYANAVIASRFLSRTSSDYLGDLFTFAEARLCPVWQRLPAALRSGLPQNEGLREPDYYANLGRDAERHRTFLRGMDALSAQAAAQIASRFPWDRYRTFVDAGGGRGALAVTLALRHPHLTGIVFDLPAVCNYFQQHVVECGLERQLTFAAGDFFRDPLPSADVAIMGHVLHNWNVEQKRFLIRAAWESLPVSGALIIYEWFLDQARAPSLLGQLMSLNMLLVTRDGCAITTADCERCLRDAGFRRTEVAHLAGPCSMVIGWKSIDHAS